MVMRALGSARCYVCIDAGHSTVNDHKEAQQKQCVCGFSRVKRATHHNFRELPQQEYVLLACFTESLLF